jgi:hypothetical protein
MFWYVLGFLLSIFNSLHLMDSEPVCSVLRVEAEDECGI